MTDKVKYGYTSPRWIGPICNCPLPMTFDTYSGCSYNCLYCFAYFQKSHCCDGYKGIEDSRKRVVKSVNPQKVQDLFINCLNDDPQNKREEQFKNYIQKHYTMQWGGMADGFDENEKKYGISLKLLKFFDKIDYPLSISTKATWFTEDKRYMKLIRKHPHNWHFKISIITNNEQKASIMEQYVPSPNERFKAMKRLSDEGINTTLRLRPYIIGLSDDFPALIKKAQHAGAKNVTTEFFCLESRANEQLKQKYKLMSKLVGYDILEFYKKHSVQQGYKRLNYNIKKPIIAKMRKLTHKCKMLFLVSDAHHREKCDTLCCCGTPTNFKVSEGNFVEALLKAKKRKDHLVYWSDIANNLEEIVGHVPWGSAEGFNTGNTRLRASNNLQSLADYVHNAWNNPKNAKSPFKYFEGVLYPVGKDKHGDVIYKYNSKKAKI